MLILPNGRDDLRSPGGVRSDNQSRRMTTEASDSLGRVTARDMVSHQAVTEHGQVYHHFMLLHGMFDRMFAITATSTRVFGEDCRLQMRAGTGHRSQTRI
jgi:hypothetical protein